MRCMLLSGTEPEDAKMRNGCFCTTAIDIVTDLWKG